MSTSELQSEKIYYTEIQALMNQHVIEKVRRGYYYWVEDYDGNEVLVIQKLFPDAILCMETALFYYHYSDRNPMEWNITIHKNASRNRFNIDYPFIKAYRVDTRQLNIGETYGKINEINVRIYDRDRTICDVLRFRNRMDKEIYNKAIQGYIADPKKNIANLIDYAKKLRIYKKVEEIIGVWL